MADKAKTDGAAAYAGSRRALLRSTGALAAAVAVGAPYLARAQSGGPVRVGVLAATTNTIAYQGAAILAGARMAADLEGNTVLGRPLEIVHYDEPNPQAATQNMRRAIQSDRCVAILGGSNSAYGLAESAVALEERIPMIVHAGSARDITGSRCHRFVFRDQITSTALCRMTAKHVIAAGKRWYGLVGAYAFGADIYAGMKQEVTPHGLVEAGRDDVPIGTTDFSSIIIKIRQASPDVVVLGLAGSDLVAFAKQFAEFGLRDRIAVVCPSSSELDIQGMGEAASGIHGLFWTRLNPNLPASQVRFGEDVMKRTGRPATQTDYQGWIAMRMLIAGMNAAGSTDPVAIVRGLEKARVDDIFYRDFDHQLMHPATLVRVKKQITSSTDLVDFLEAGPKLSEMDTLHGTREEVGCTMPPV